MRYRALMFDLDNTLAERVSSPSAEMTERIATLLEKLPVGVITAASYSRLEQMFLTALPSAARLENLYLFPDMGGQCYHWKNGWKLLYENPLPEAERRHVLSVLNGGIAETGIVEGVPQYGERIEVHEAQVIFTALGINAPREQKLAWDADGAKRRKLKAYLDEHLEGFDVYIGGRTTIDITKKGFDKAYGVRRFAEFLGCKPGDMLYIGDELYPGGNDAVVIPTGIQTRETSGPTETLRVIDELLSRLN